LKKKKQLLEEDSSKKINDGSGEEDSEEDDTYVPMNIWIVKPGENSNCGEGISVCSTLGEIRGMVGPGTYNKNTVNLLDPKKRKKRTYIVQKYIERPLLINKRKFDIRLFGLLTSING
jgi:tubulin--tyrosine ligase